MKSFEALKKSGFFWAYGIIVALLIFMSGTVFMVWKTSQVKIDLVTDDYYEKTIGYQEHINKEALGRLTENALSWKINAKKDSLWIHFPTPLESNASLHLYRPNAREWDRDITLPSGAQTSALAIERLPKGAWELHINWTRNDKPIFSKLDIWL